MLFKLTSTTVGIVTLNHLLNKVYVKSIICHVPGTVQVDQDRCIFVQ